MQFKHPELLYALFLLLIPIIIHLFQLRKFKTEAFTNVAFLKKINIQTRKSNTLKKWLVLCMRMALLACIVIAFAQPFFTEFEGATKEKETVIYLDNSFSMQAKGPSGQLLKSAAQDLLTNIPDKQVITLFTNDEIFRKTTIASIRNKLLQLPYSPQQLTQEVIIAKAQNEFARDNSTEKRLILISDFQDKGISKSMPLDEIEMSYVQLAPMNRNNISVDTLFISSLRSRSLEITVQLTTSNIKDSNTSVSLYNGDKLLAKGTASFNDKLSTTVIFDIENSGLIEGRVLIEDPLLPFDNTLYFSINKSRPIRVLVINGENDDYLRRIFTAPEFDYDSVALNDLNFSNITDYNFIVVNELNTLSTALTDALDAFAKAGNTSAIILRSDSNFLNIQQTLRQLGNFQVSKTLSDKRLVTTINYNHPIYKDVFDSRIKNFQYPSVSSSFNIRGGDPVLKFEDGSSFITENNGIYMITGALNTVNSNFKNSPLIVPTFYNMARQSLDLPKLYFYTTKKNSFDIAATLDGDEILSLKNINDLQNTVIPLQESKGSKVRITTGIDFSKAGTYDVLLGDTSMQQVSFNHPRDESILRYKELEKQKASNYTTSVETLFDEFKTKDSVQSLWQWFIIFALFFLLLEILILKFYK